MSFLNAPLEQLVEQTPPWVNRRATVRYHCGPATPGRLFLATKEEFVPAWILDISLGGMGLLMNRPLEAGLSVVIQMKNSSGKQAYRLAALVAHTTHCTRDEWMVGCSFVEALTRDQLDDLL